MKRIICLNQDCRFNEHNHCFFYNSYIMINEDGFCQYFETKTDYQERINKALTEKEDNVRN